MKLPRRLFLTLGLGAFLLTGCAHTGAADTAPPAAEIYILAGQSNMQGIGKLADLPAAEKTPPADVFFWNGTTFEPLVPGVTHTSTRQPEFGPELGLAQVLAARSPRRKVFFIKYHMGGQPLHPGWNGNRWEGGPPAAGRTNFYPGRTADDPARGQLYRNLLDTAARGVAALKQQGIEADIRALVWMQGEQDSKNEVSAREYPQMLKLLKERLAADLGVSALPLVYGQVLPYEPALEKFTHRTLIRQGMADADSRSGKPAAIPGAFMVSTDGMSLGADHVHYDAAGQLALGRAFGEALVEHASR